MMKATDARRKAQAVHVAIELAQETADDRAQRLEEEAKVTRVKQLTVRYIHELGGRVDHATRQGKFYVILKKETTQPRSPRDETEEIVAFRAALVAFKEAGYNGEVVISYEEARGVYYVRCTLRW